MPQQIKIYGINEKAKEPLTEGKIAGSLRHRGKSDSARKHFTREGIPFLHIESHLVLLMNRHYQKRHTEASSHHLHNHQSGKLTR